MIRELRGATIWSEDLNKLLPFYRDTLGLPVALQVPGFVVLGEPGAPARAAREILAVLRPASVEAGC